MAHGQTDGKQRAQRLEGLSFRLWGPCGDSPVGLSVLSQPGLTSQGLGREFQEQGKDSGLQRENGNGWRDGGALKDQVFKK